jgi:hypothetical protein
MSTALKEDYEPRLRKSIAAFIRTRIDNSFAVIIIPSQTIRHLQNGLKASSAIE